MKAVFRYLAVITASCLALALGGCASQLTEDEQYEREVAFHESRDQIRAFISNCEAVDHVVFYTGPPTHKLRDPIKRIPRHARPSDYHCASGRDTESFQLEMGLR